MPASQIASLFPGLRVLVVEDLIALAIQYRTLAARLEVQVTTAGTMAEAKRLVQLGPWHAALVDLNLPDGSGFEVMQALLQAHPACSVVVITAEESLDNAVRASKEGAFDFIQKPVEAERLLLTLRNALHASRLSQRVATLQTDAPKQFEQFIGQSAEMQTVYRMIDTVAASNAPVCISGESGTGKELVALAIHARSPRRGKKLVTINSAAIPKELIESELFGHIKGAFTGAVADRPGVFLEADKGTLFLDEIAELDLSVQAKLLRVLQTGEVKRLGEDRTRLVDVRIVCATHRNLAERVRSGEFREDLFYRLFVVPIELPPLRSRGNDVLLIADELLKRYAKEDGKKFKSFSLEAMAALRAHSWPGNVRELINVVRAVVALYDGEQVLPIMLPASVARTPAAPPAQVAGLASNPGKLPATVQTPIAGADFAQPETEVEPTPWFAQAFENSQPAFSGSAPAPLPQIGPAPLHWPITAPQSLAGRPPAAADLSQQPAQHSEFTSSHYAALQPGPPSGFGTLPGPLTATASNSSVAPLPATLTGTRQPDTFERSRVRPLAHVEREVVDYALRAFGGNVAQAARALQVNPSTLYRKIQVWTAAGELTLEPLP